MALIDSSSTDLPLLMLRRSRTMRSHPGQFALPGGAQMDSDGPLWRTALRESEEELGVPAAAVEALGYLDSVRVAHSGFLVTPVVGLLHGRFAPRLQLEEVEESFWLPLLDRSGRVRIDQQPKPLTDGSTEVPGYLFEGHFIWGVTGLILDDLRRRLGAATSRPATLS